MNGMLALGLLFPLLSCVTLLLAWRERRRSGRRVSAVLVPFIGPLLVGAWWVDRGGSARLLPLLLLADPGTLLFCLAVPGLARDAWRTSRFTLLHRFSGRTEAQEVGLTLHRGGHYQMERRIHRSPGEPGLVSLGEPGNWEPEGEGFRLVSWAGEVRRLSPEGEAWRLAEAPAGARPDAPPLADCPLAKMK